MNRIVVTGADVGKRLDLFLSEEIDESRSYVKNGDIVEYELPEIKQLDLTPADIPIDVIYEDDDVAVINKAQGMVVHPAPGSYDNTLVNALLFRLKSLSSINGVARPGIVHRLDKDTSGLLVVAKNDEAHVSLQSQIASKEAKRYYIALVDGVINKDEGVIDTNIDRSQKDRKMMAVCREGKGRRAITHYKVLERLGGYTLVEYELKTGRTHQIRVHSKHIGHPIVGDSVYGGSTSLYDQGQLLHAFRLQFTHPSTKELMTFEAPLPNYFADILEKLRNKYNK